jgi:hypothetical protein
MAYALTWLSEVLLNAGLRVAEDPGWEARGRSEMGEVLGVLCHHTASGAPGNMPSLRVLREGRPDLAGPLSQLGLGRDGTYYIVAAGRCNHAGVGSWKGIIDGNAHFIGIEAENNGDGSDLWPSVQLDAYRRGVAAILRKVGQGSEWCIGHKEFAPGRKDDPNFDMAAFRADVRTILDGNAAPPALIPALEPAPGDGAVARPTLQRGATGELVQRIQRKLMCDADGNFGPATEAAVRVFQRNNGLVPDGIVGPKTWAAMDQELL